MWTVNEDELSEKLLSGVAAEKLEERGGVRAAAWPCGARMRVGDPAKSSNAPPRKLPVAIFSPGLRRENAKIRYKFCTAREGGN